MGFNLLSMFAKAGVAYLHPGGKKSTAFLINAIKPADSMKVLEVGCGTGATLAQLSHHAGVRLYGVDISAQMLETAAQRLAYCGVSSVSLKLLEPGGKLPFEDGFFDAVYAESVLGIVEQPALNACMTEIKRVLKPGGSFLAVDAVWKVNTPLATIRKINDRCRKDFGIIQSNESPSNEAEWTDFFGQMGFVNITSFEVQAMESIKTDSSHVQSSSDTFTKLKRRTALLNPAFIWAYVGAYLLIKCVHRSDGKQLQNWFFKMQKKP